MRKYINKTSNGTLGPKNKVQALVDDGATILNEDELSYQNNLVCVVDNVMFEAAAYCDSPRVFEVFTHPDGRVKTWLIWDKVKEFAQ